MTTPLTPEQVEALVSRAVEDERRRIANDLLAWEQHEIEQGRHAAAWAFQDFRDSLMGGTEADLTAAHFNGEHPLEKFPSTTPKEGEEDA